MNSFAKLYMKNVKSLFPVVGKEEKNYLKNLQTNVESYCEDQSVSSIDQLYKDLGSPDEVINNYYSSIDISHIIKRINIAKYVKMGIVIFLLIAIIVASVYCTILYDGHQVFKKESVFSEETVLE